MNEKYTAEIRLPTQQYGYINVETFGTLDEIIDLHNTLIKTYNVANTGIGLTRDEFNAVLDKFLWNGKGESGMSPDEYERMSAEQKAVIQEVKKSKKRRDYVPPEGLHHGAEPLSDNS